MNAVRHLDHVVRATVTLVAPAAHVPILLVGSLLLGAMPNNVAIHLIVPTAAAVALAEALSAPPVVAAIAAAVAQSVVLSAVVAAGGEDHGAHLVTVLPLMAMMIKGQRAALLVVVAADPVARHRDAPHPAANLTMMLLHPHRAALLVVVAADPVDHHHDALRPVVNLTMMAMMIKGQRAAPLAGGAAAPVAHHRDAPRPVVNPTIMTNQVDLEVFRVGVQVVTAARAVNAGPQVRLLRHAPDARGHPVIARATKIKIKTPVADALAWSAGACLELLGLAAPLEMMTSSKTVRTMPVLSVVHAFAPGSRSHLTMLKKAKRQTKRATVVVIASGDGGETRRKKMTTAKRSRSPTKLLPVQKAAKIRKKTMIKLPVAVAVF